MTPFDKLITQYFLSKEPSIALVIGFLRLFRVLHIDASKVVFVPCHQTNDSIDPVVFHTRLKLIYFEIITQLNLCGRLIKKICKKDIPRSSEIRLFRNMCVDHYDDYIAEPTSADFGFLITRHIIDGVFPCGEYVSGKNQPPLYLKMKNNLELAIKNANIDFDQTKIDNLFDDWVSDSSKTFLYFLLGKTYEKRLQEKNQKNKRDSLRLAIWNFGLPAPFSDTDQYFKNDFLPFVTQLLNELEKGA